MKIIRLDDVQIFVHTADAGSFSEAARQLNIAPAQASASVQRLEKALDARLFTRSTRSMQLSEAGERYLPHARVMLGAREQGEQALAGGREALSGRCGCLLRPISGETCSCRGSTIFSTSTLVYRCT